METTREVCTPLRVPQAHLRHGTPFQRLPILKRRSCSAREQGPFFTSTNKFKEKKSLASTSHTDLPSEQSDLNPTRPLTALFRAARWQLLTVFYRFPTRAQWMHSTHTTTLEVRIYSLQWTIHTPNLFSSYCLGQDWQCKCHILSQSTQYTKAFSRRALLSGFIPINSFPFPFFPFLLSTQHDNGKYIH